MVSIRRLDQNKWQMPWLFCFIFNVFLIHPVLHLQSILFVAIPFLQSTACMPTCSAPSRLPSSGSWVGPAPCPTLCSSWSQFRTYGQEPGSLLLRHLMTLTYPHLGWGLGSRNFHLEFWRPSHSSLDCVDLFNCSLVNPTPCPVEVLGPICIYLFLYRTWVFTMQWTD